MIKHNTARGRRDILDQSRRFAMLEAAGIDPSQIGKVFNRAAPGTPRTAEADEIHIPTGAAELADMLRDSQKMAKIVGTPAFGEFITNYARSQYDQDLSIKAQVETQVQATLADWIKENDGAGVQRPDMRAAVQQVASLKPGESARMGLYNPKAMGAVVDKDYADSGDYFRTIWHKGQQNNTADRQSRLTRLRNAFSSTVPSEGGFLIPETLRSEILRVSLETSIIRPRARVIPMETLRVPFPAIDSTSNVSSLFGGIVGYWTEEGAALTASSATFGRVVLDAKKLTMYTEVPNELIADSLSSFQAFIDTLFPEAMGFEEDYAFIQGNGVGQPLGFLNALSAVSVAAEAGQPATTIVWENLVNMFSRMLPSSLGRAVWIASIDTFPQLATMALSVGTGGSAIWLNNGALGPPMTILGRPVIFTEKVPKLGAAGDINFVDLGFYLIGDRQVMSAMSSEHYKFGNDVTAYRIIERVDGRPWLQSAITPRNGGATISPFVKIAAR